MRDTLLIANRGEIAVRVMRTARERGWRTAAVYSQDDSAAMHVSFADVAVGLDGQGAAAYLSIEKVIAAAKKLEATAIHPGYGFLSENPSFARACEDAGISFVGPTAHVLSTLGDKATARDLAQQLGLPVLPGTGGAITLDGAEDFLRAYGGGNGIILKAVAGGGGRGSRIVLSSEELPSAYERCRSEALAAFGNGDLLAERFIARARHIEVQIIGDRYGNVGHLWDRDCSIQRRHQKVVEIAPAVTLTVEVRRQIIDAAKLLARQLGYSSLGTFEFLVDVDSQSFYFIEANPRIQVEHTVTEEVFGIDLVSAQLDISRGMQLGEINLPIDQLEPPAGVAVQLRINLEAFNASGDLIPTSGTIEEFMPPFGQGVRVDTAVVLGQKTSTLYDPLIAKLIIRSRNGGLSEVADRCVKELGDFRLRGVKTNLPVLRALVARPEFREGSMSTRFIDDQLRSLFEWTQTELPVEEEIPALGREPGTRARNLSGDPLAVLGLSGAPKKPRTSTADTTETGQVVVASPVQGTIIELLIPEDGVVLVGHTIAVIESMKMEHTVECRHSGRVVRSNFSVGDVVGENEVLVLIEASDQSAGEEGVAGGEVFDLDAERVDSAYIIRLQSLRRDQSRPEIVKKRHAGGKRTVHENIADLCDAESLLEYGGLALTPGLKGDTEEILRRYPADGMVSGVGSVNAATFGVENSKVVICAYDYTVLAGTQGPINHPKTDRMLELAKRQRLPLVFFTEGGGGRAGTGGDRDGSGDRPNAPSGASFGRPLVTPTFTSLARLNGLVPTVGINSGRCFAGNAAVLGACDVVIATEDSNIGMGGPAMVEGGGLGAFAPEEIGDIEDQWRSGVVDIRVKDEVEAVAAAKRYLSYFQGRSPNWEESDQRVLRHIVPENRLRAYDIRRVINALADVGSVLELRGGFGLGIVTALARLNGRPMGIVANNPTHLAGAIDSSGADKAARFMQLCEAHGLPILVLCDTPGIMVGPEVERTGLVRHSNRLFAIGSNLTVPMMFVVVRKAYGLGALAMAGGSVHEPTLSVAWPTGEFAGMGLEGQVKLGYRQELEAIVDPQEKLARYNELVEEAYVKSKAVNQAYLFGIDDVIDPATTRSVLSAAMDASLTTPRVDYPRRIDTW